MPSMAETLAGLGDTARGLRGLFNVTGADTFTLGTKGAGIKSLFSYTAALKEYRAITGKDYEAGDRG